MQRELDVAWLAGLIDGEGHLAFRKNNRSDRPNPTYQPLIRIGMYTRAPVARAAKIMGTSLKKNRHYLRHIWVIDIVGREKVERLLREMLPHLTAKRLEAELLLQAMTDCPARRPIQGIKGLPPISRGELALREGYYLAIRVAKKIVLDAPMLEKR